MIIFEAERPIIAKQVLLRLKEIFKTVYSNHVSVDSIERCVLGPGHSVTPEPVSGWEPFELKQRWGGYDQTTWFRLHATIPPDMDGKHVVALLSPHQGPHGNSLAYVNGHPAQGLDRNRDEVLLSKQARVGEAFVISLESVPSQEQDTYHIFDRADIAVFHQLAWDFYWDAKIALEVWEQLPEAYAPRMRLLDHIEKSVRMVDLRHAGTPQYFESIKKAQKYFRAGLKKFPAGPGAGKLAIIGHSHIDTAWMWPLRETHRKIGRTVATVLALLDRYPEFTFSHSQTIQYEYLKQDYPELFARMKQRVREGRWDPAGALFVEPDCNIVSGESIVRQLLFGIHFFQQEFGVRPRLAWVPDCFGFAHSLPQFLVKAGLDTFSTTKIWWGEFSQFPYSTFHWEGVDGSRILTHMPHVYGSIMTTAEVFEHWAVAKQKDKIDEIPYTVGWGDGGGGPTQEIVERAKRLGNIVGAPQCSFDTLTSYFARFANDEATATLPVWNSELYLEVHRGCQTSQARTKRNNRKCEVLLRDVEFLSTVAFLNGGHYEQGAINDAWKIVLLNQFHDILPGSSVHEVYDDADRDYALAQTALNGVKDRALALLHDRIDTRGEGTPIIVWNTASWARSGLVAVKVPVPKGAFHVQASDGNAVSHQVVSSDELLVEVTQAPSLGHAVYRIVPGKGAAQSFPLTASDKGMENAFLKIVFDKSGRLTRVYDKENKREVLAPKERGNVLYLFDDRPHRSNAWDIDQNLEDTRWEPGASESVEVVERGPLRATVRFVRKNEQSTITQDIVLYAHSRRIDFVTHVDWQEKQTMMKVAFPVDVRSSWATFEIPCGTIQRTTHTNRDYDLAEFEVPALRWADISEGDYGVSVLNDCKYGYDVKGNTLRLSLLRAPIDPDPNADEGGHDFTYSLLTHVGDWRVATVREGIDLNVPLMAKASPVSEGTLPPVGSFAEVDAEHVILETIKCAEDSDAIIVRLYEAYGQRGYVTLRFARAPKRMFECDLLEENDMPLDVKDNAVELYMTPYKICSLKVIF
ncbi:MAG TPA: glycoside hydrolase family 38 C-terminal domain-containing protein [Candidatus Hydrogenedentes bacterium]|nr:glycoside hydrolase family 38 C-terminal domain-containing protein [Candidatus Hydrogenedentota bacterium]